MPIVGVRPCYPLPFRRNGNFAPVSTLMNR